MRVFLALAAVVALCSSVKADIVHEFEYLGRTVCGIGGGCNGHYIFETIYFRGTLTTSEWDSANLLITSVMLDSSNTNILLGAGYPTTAEPLLSADFARLPNGLRLANGLVAVPGAFYYNNSYQVGQFSVAIPEPSTWAMLLIGFAGIGFATYRRRLINGCT